MVMETIARHWLGSKLRIMCLRQLDVAAVFLCNSYVQPNRALPGPCYPHLFCFPTSSSQESERITPSSAFDLFHVFICLSGLFQFGSHLNVKGRPCDWHLSGEQRKLKARNRPQSTINLLMGTHQKVSR